MELTDKVAITLEAGMWNGVLDALHSAPYRQAAPVIAEIMRQVQDVEMKRQMASRDAPVEGQVIPPTANGAAHAP
jgi:hypothetical protein